MFASTSLFRVNKFPLTLVFLAFILTACGGSSTGPTGATGPGITWVNVTSITQQAVSNTGYLADNAAQVTITLPASSAVGDVIQVNGIGTGGWKIVQNAGQLTVTKNILGQVSYVGTTWTAQASGSQPWHSVASSADGTHLVAAMWNGQIYTSTNAGGTWTAQASGSQLWQTVASSADGTHLVAVVWNGQIYTSADAGITWTAQASGSQLWQSVASSADGTHLVATVYGGQIYTSADAGVTWTGQASGNKSWQSVASSADGTHLVAVVWNGQVYTSEATQATATTTGTAGSISGGQYDAIALQYIGNNTFSVLNYTGTLDVQ